MQSEQVRELLRTHINQVSQSNRITHVVPSGILRLDCALGGGLPVGITELYGVESVGKTGLLGHVLASCQRANFFTLLCVGDYLDLNYFERLGLCLDQTVLLRELSDFGMFEQSLLNSQQPICLGIDSLTSIDNEIGWEDRWCRRLDSIRKLLPSGSIIICTSQVRSRHLQRNSQQVRSASAKLSELVECSLFISRKMNSIDRFSQIIDIRKSSHAPPGVVFSIPFLKGMGVMKDLDLVRLGVENQVITSKGSFLYLSDLLLGQGEKAASEKIFRNPNLRNKLVGYLTSQKTSV